MHAATAATFLFDYRAIAGHLGIDTRLQDQDLLDAVRTSIEALENWVLILDNADDLSLFGIRKRGQNDASHDYFCHLPQALSGTVLWTSRDESVVGTLVGLGKGIHVGSMTMIESMDLLGITWNTERLEDRPGAIEILNKLEGHPLAISQAGAYMRRASMSALAYLKLLEEEKKRWLISKKPETDVYQRPLVSNSAWETWSISMERIRIENKMAYRMVYIAAYMDHRNVPVEIILTRSGKLGRDDKDDDDAESVGEDEGGLEVQLAIKKLVEFSLLKIVKTENRRWSYQMDRLVQEAAQYQGSIEGTDYFDLKTVSQCDSNGMKGWFSHSKIALQILCKIFPIPSKRTERQCEQYLAHASMIGLWAKHCRMQAEGAELLSRVADFLFDRGWWRERELIGETALQLRQDVLGENHPDTISSKLSLAMTYYAQGHYGKAELIDVHVLAVRREVLGERHPDTMNSMASLVATYYQQGRYDEAELVSLHVLSLQREFLGEKHPDTISSMAYLGSTYYQQGHYDKAEPIGLHVLVLRREVLGEKHPETISSMVYLATTYYAQGHYNKAKSVYAKVLDLRKEVLGETHQDTIWSMAYLATTYHAEGQYLQADIIKAEILDLRQKIQGVDHPETLQAMHDLATSWYVRGRHEEAASLMSQYLNRRRSTPES